MPRLIFGLFLLLPLVEIAGFVLVGDAIGLWPTLALVVGAFLAGGLLLRLQGLSTWRQVQQSLNRGEQPLEPLFHGFCIMLAGILLAIPGFFTDILALLLLVGPVRRWLRRGIRLYGPRGRAPGAPGATVIDGEYREVRGADILPPDKGDR